MDIDNLMAGVSIVATSETNQLQRIVPHKIETQADIRRIKFQPYMQRLGSIHRVMDMIYHNSKKFLVELDNTFDSLIKDVESGAMTKELKEIDVEKCSKDIIGLKNIHERMSINIKKISEWCKDEFLISAISFHIKLADSYYSNLSDKKIRENVKQLAKNAEKIAEKIIELKDVSKAAIIISMEPLLVYGAFLAYQRHDYKYILEYEKAVINTAKQISKYKPGLIEKYLA